jgi:hypothetical protein
MGSNGTTGYAFIGIIGGIMALLFGGTIYYAKTLNESGAPTGFSPVPETSALREKSALYATNYRGGKRTKRRRKHLKKSRKL